MSKETRPSQRPSARVTALALVAFAVAGVLLLVTSIPLWLRLFFVGVASGALVAQGMRIKAAMAVGWEVDDDGVRELERSRVVGQIRWRALILVSVITTGDRGPWSQELHFVLHDEHGTQLAIPLDRAAEIGLLTRLQQLPGFDNQAVAEATRSPEACELICWQREPSTSTP